MVSRIIEGMVGFVTGMEPTNERQVTDDEDESTVLYTCSDCKETYITDDMDECPKCGDAVELTPSFSELGIGRNGEW